MAIKCNWDPYHEHEIFATVLFNPLKDSRNAIYDERLHCTRRKILSSNPVWLEDPNIDIEDIITIIERMNSVEDDVRITTCLVALCLDSLAYGFDKKMLFDRAQELYGKLYELVSKNDKYWLAKLCPAKDALNIRCETAIKRLLAISEMDSIPVSADLIETYLNQVESTVETLIKKCESISSQERYREKKYRSYIIAAEIFAKHSNEERALELIQKIHDESPIASMEEADAWRIKGNLFYKQKTDEKKKEAEAAYVQAEKTINQMKLINRSFSLIWVVQIYIDWLEKRFLLGVEVEDLVTKVENAWKCLEIEEPFFADSAYDADSTDLARRVYRRMSLLVTLANTQMKESIT